mmetsp:Transcript_3120/g.6789  ORF Transcript_3120/g.6789 Transcript_3120/m.6789 type:complete len:550 (+) Transcript_3120:140-1789(+)|eukprot:CAMPEP_0202907414 /NCGR_PEP_ID=MMETSP1392-20130828/42399_1 /ASSEMBLY_ACC=CAM_ASM_000868 /TAXON_ID=225041 /ORGANISM="Chlamydomonas chlamydogama, Strain SAG 11-48b" /LENGTH=549 /DNA_ID=CAMNT_0049596281 /DNA_START=78 /DNA_END=1727 /DNA_ORIENTATION=+
MQFLGAPPEPAPINLGRNATKHTLLSLYTDTPTEDIALDDFERYALDRLRVLKGIEEVKLRGKSDDDVKAQANKLFEKHIEGADNEETRRRDQLSHFILRLAYCSKPDLRKWFLTQECELFKARFGSLLESNTDKSEFLRRSGLKYEPVSEAEKQGVQGAITQVLQSCGEWKDVHIIISEGVYKVPFQAVPDLVAGRKVLLMRGQAYVVQRDLVSLVMQDFRASLSKGMAAINRRWNQIFPPHEQRLKPLVEGLSQRYLGADYGSSVQRRSDVSISNLASLSTKHFPLCMHHMMLKLKQEHHLRHQGRQQLSLFLKSIGLPLEEALLFWRQEFAPRVPSDKFDKEYAYNIRHNYGKEGKMADYTAHNCTTIVKSTGGAADHHGCPYRRLDEPTLRAMLASLKCESSKIEEAVLKARHQHYQLACAAAFEGTHHTSLDAGIQHPAQYYSESRRVYDEREGAVPGKTAADSSAKEGQAQAAAGAGPTTTPGSTLRGAQAAAGAGRSTTPLAAGAAAFRSRVTTPEGGSAPTPDPSGLTAQKPSGSRTPGQA